MPINFNEVYESLYNIQDKVSRMMLIVQLAKKGECVVDNVGTFTFTVAQKTMLKNQYLSLKAEIKTFWETLP